MRPIAEVPADLKRQAYDCYVRHPAMSLDAIAAILGISRSTFLRLRKAWNWPRRREAVASAKGQSREAALAAFPEMECAGASASPLREAALSLAQVTRSRIQALVKEQRSGRPIDHDKSARTLAAYAKTLTTAQALLEQDSGKRDDAEPQEGPTRTIHELRAELARHLERVVAEEEARGCDGILV